MHVQDEVGMLSQAQILIVLPLPVVVVGCVLASFMRPGTPSFCNAVWYHQAGQLPLVRVQGVWWRVQCHIH